ncbi:MAG: exodeoxyribonuclease III [Legionellaceae bacterium]
MPKLASFNVNSLNVRLEDVLLWLDTSQADCLAVQETKVTDDRFPLAPFEERGYHVVYTGEKTYNGVALISRIPLKDPVFGVPGFDDPQRRVIGATVDGIRMLNLYVPNGAAVGTDKYEYKLNWLKKVTTFIREELQRYPDLVVVGDFNIAPEDKDVHDPALWAGSVLVSPPEREAFQGLLSLGLHDSFRAIHPEAVRYSWWDYRMAAFRRNRGMRIDHILLSDALIGRCIDSGIDEEPRRSERPSDHTPVWVLL